MQQQQQQQQQHLIILVHGWLGNEKELLYLHQQLEQRAPLNVHVHSSTCNAGKTFDGIKAGGQRLAQEILDQIQVVQQSHQQEEEHNIKANSNVAVRPSLSLICNSLGGLYARMALGCMEIDQFHLFDPRIFCTLSTPHLGLRDNTWLHRHLEFCVAKLLQQTGEDLFQHSNAIEEIGTAPFLMALGRFQQRVAYANAHGTDVMVPTATAAFLAATDDLHTFVEQRAIVDTTTACLMKDSSTTVASEEGHEQKETINEEAKDESDVIPPVLMVAFATQKTNLVEDLLSLQELTPIIENQTESTTLPPSSASDEEPPSLELSSSSLDATPNMQTKQINNTAAASTTDHEPLGGDQSYENDADIHVIPSPKSDATRNIVATQQEDTNGESRETDNSIENEKLIKKENAKSARRPSATELIKMLWGRHSLRHINNSEQEEDECDENNCSITSLPNLSSFDKTKSLDDPLSPVNEKNQQVPQEEADGHPKTSVVAMSKRLDSLGWTKVFWDLRTNNNNEVAEDIEFQHNHNYTSKQLMKLQKILSVNPDIEFQHNHNYTSKQLKDYFCHEKVVDFTYPIGHTMLVANSKNPLYERIHRKGRPVMDYLAQGILNDLALCTEDKTELCDF